MNEPALKYKLEWSMVHPDILDECWEDCAKLLKKSVKRSGGRVTINDVYRDIASGCWCNEYHLFIGYHPDKKLLFCGFKFPFCIGICNCLH